MPLVHKHYRMGKAPYRFIGIYSIPSPALAEANPSAYNAQLKAMPKFCSGMCDHCGMGITHHYMLKDAEGNKFAVGSSCIDKMDDVENMFTVDYERKELEHKKRKAIREAKQLERQMKYERELEEQRQRNGGLTDNELAEQKREDEQRQKRRNNEEKFAYFIEHLGLSNGFAGDLARGMRDYGRLPTGRGLDIMLEIVAKTAGRKNSKAYDAKYEEAETKLEELS